MPDNGAPDRELGAILPIEPGLSQFALPECKTQDRGRHNKENDGGQAAAVPRAIEARQCKTHRGAEKWRRIGDRSHFGRDEQGHDPADSDGGRKRDRDNGSICAPDRRAVAAVFMERYRARRVHRALRRRRGFHAIAAPAATAATRVPARNRKALGKFGRLKRHQVVREFPRRAPTEEVRGSCSFNRTMAPSSNSLSIAASLRKGVQFEGRKVTVGYFFADGTQSLVDDGKPKLQRCEPQGLPPARAKIDAGGQAVAAFGFCCAGA